MKRSASILFFVISMGLTAAYFMPYSAEGESDIDSLKAEIEAKSQEIKKLEEEAKNFREQVLVKGQEAASIKNEIAKIDLNLKKLSSDIRLTDARIFKAKLEIRELGEEVLKKEGDIDRTRQDLRRILVNISRKDEETALVIFSKYETLAQFFDSIYHLLGLERGVHDRLSSLKVFKKELTDAKTRAESKKNELSGFLVNLGTQKITRETERRGRAALLADAKNQEKRLQQLLDLTETQQEAILKEIEVLEDKLRQAIDPSSLPDKREGVLAWPAKGILSQGYGRTPFSRRSHFYSFHNGIDVKASIGSPVVAADDGNVLTTGDSDRYCRRGAYGKYIVIKHGNNLTTMYAHLSLILVTPGDTVKRGDTIGHIGSSGLSTGPHLHFTVYDSRTVDVRPSRLCGPLPYGGSVNPLDYL